ncbi:MAG: hypothetical protein M3436_11970 [Pseudomonadota bacterium]|nr:hypothetical protein [Pseudomonadota bacterium]
MRIFRPSDSLVRSVQNDEGRFYFSAAFEVILKKYGWVLSQVEPPAAATAQAFGFVTRSTAWQETFSSLPLVFEGPLAASVLSHLGIATRMLVAKQLELFDGQGEHLGTLRFNRASLRRIPANRTEISEPYPFEAEDRRWTPQTFSYQAFERLNDGDPIVWGVDTSGSRHVLGVRSGPHLVFGVPLLDIMVQHHLMPPYPHRYYAMTTWSNLEPLERWLLSASEAWFRRHDRVTIAVDRWPHSKRACLTVRHDFDRDLRDDTPKVQKQRADISRLLQCYVERGIKSTWFWRIASYHPKLIDDVTSAGHEVALHTEAFDFGQWYEQEIKFFREQADVPIAGYTVHGGGGAAGYLGQRQIRWAQASGMSYGELVGGQISLPTLAIVVDNDIPTTSSVVLPAWHRGLDLSMRPEGHRLSTLLPEAAKRLANGEHCVIMNHPDIHIEEMIALSNSLDLADVWPATMAEVASWVLARNGVYRKDGTRSMSLTWGQPLPYSATLSIGHGDNAHSVVLPQGTCVVHVNLAEAQPRIVLSSNGSTSAAAIAIEPNTKQSMP